ncbi:MAG: Hcp family type VI secretion system effector [Magnetovibrionaceae bacterium]
MDAIVLDFGNGEDAVEGECQLEGYVGKILCLGFQHGVSMPMNWDVSNMKRTVGKTMHTDFQLTKKFEMSSPKLNYYCSIGKEFKAVKISCFQADGADDFMLFLEYTLDNVLISDLSISGGASDVPIESMSLNYSKIKWVYKKQKTDAEQEGQIAYEFDMAAAKGAAAS